MASRSTIASPDLAVIIRAFEGGGAQRDVILLSNALAAQGARIAILTLRREGPLRDLLDPAVAVFEVPGQKLRYVIPGLRRTIRAMAPAAVLASEASLNLCTLIAVRTLPQRSRPTLVLREVGSPSFAQRHDPYRQNRLAYRILRRFYQYADRIITLTDGARCDLIENFSVAEETVSVMHTNAVIPPAMVKRLAQWDGESGRESDLIVCVGRLSPEKDHRTLLRAMMRLAVDRPCRLAIVGDGPERGGLENFARDNGLADHVAFIGQVADPFVWMMRARVAVCSSIYEGLGNAIIEALACGTAVVSTACPYGPSEILQNGRYGALTPVGDAAAMADAIATVLNRVPDRRALMRRGLDYAAARAAERFLEIVPELGVRPGNTQQPIVAAAS